MGRVILVTGGARSGKSGFAEALARERGGRVAYIATAEASDSEMAERIAHHRARRPAEWMTVEAPLNLGGGVHDVESDMDIVLVDCLGVWTANRLLALGEPEQENWWEQVHALETALMEELGTLIGRVQSGAADLILVTNEVGFGLVPPTPLGRAFRDVLGRLNQTVAAQADAVFLVVAGLPVDLKRLALSPETCGL